MCLPSFLAVFLSFGIHSQVNHPSESELLNHSNLEWSVDAFDHWFSDVRSDEIVLPSGEAIYFTSRTQLGQLFFTKSGVTFLTPIKLSYDQQISMHEIYEARENGDDEEKFDNPKPHVHKINFVGFNPSLELIGEERSSHYSMFGESRHNNFEKLRYSNVYPNIDIIFSLPQSGGLKYDIIIHPGGNVEDIQIRHDNAEIKQIEGGDLIISHQDYLLYDKTPTAYKNDGSELDVIFSTQDDLVSFETGSYNINDTIVIDPYIQFLPDTNFTNWFIPAKPLIRNINFDLQGNLYCSVDYLFLYPQQVYARGFQYRKYSPSGNLLWTYIEPNLVEVTCDVTINPVNGDSYLLSGTTATEYFYLIDSTGLVQNFSDSTGMGTGLNFLERWSIRYDNCYDTLITGLGLCPVQGDIVFQSPNLANNIPPAYSDLLPCTFNLQEANSLTLDPTGGSAYFAMNLSQFPTNARLFKVDYSQIGANPQLVWDTLTVSSNYRERTIADVLSCGREYLYYFDGSTLEKRNKNTGVLLDTLNLNTNSSGLLNTIPYPSLFVSSQGIDLDLCGNVYVGQPQEVQVYDPDLNYITQYSMTNLDTIVDIQIHEDQMAVGGFNYLEVFTLPSFSSNVTLNITVNQDSCGSCNGFATVDSLSIPCPDLDSLDILWSNGQTTSTATGLCEGWYSVTIGGGCLQQEFSDSIYISNDSLNCPLKVALVGDTICAGECIDLIASTTGNYTGPMTYQWNNGITETDSITNVCPLISTVYQVVGVDALGQSDTSQVLITVVSPPVGNLGNDTTICSSPFTLDAQNSGSFYQWQDGSTNQTLDVGLSGYYWVIIDNGICTDSVGVNIDVIDISVDLGADTNYCGTIIDVSLDAGNPGASYLWNDNSADQLLEVTNQGSYSVAVTLSGCTVYDTVVFGLIPYPVIDLGNDTILCAGDSIILNAQNTGASCLWNDGSTNQLYIVSNAGTYWVELANGYCISSDTISIDYDSLSVDLGPDIVTCGSDTIVLDAGNAGSSYLWSNNSTNQSINISSEGLYSVLVTNTLGCFDIDTVQLLIQNVNASFVDPIIEGCEPLEVQFTDESTVNFGTITNWNWDFGNGLTSNSQNPTQAYPISANNNYSVQLMVVSNYGCTDDTTIAVQVNAYAKAIAEFNYSPSDIEAYQNISFENLSINANSWQWIFGDGSSSTDENPQHAYYNAGLYTVTLIAKNDFGCNDTVTFELNISEDILLFVPNSFTPNGDEFNQVWGVQISGKAVNNYSLTVYNRWGEVIWVSYDPEVSWDGTYNGEVVQDGTYSWKIELATGVNADRKIYTGNVNVIR